MENQRGSITCKNNLTKVSLFLVIISLGFLFTSFEKVFSEENLTPPMWLKTPALWWSEDKISDQEFVNSLQYLLDNRILFIQEPVSETFVGIDTSCGPYLILNTTVSNPGKSFASSDSRCTTIPGWGGTGIIDDEFFDLNTTQSGFFVEATGTNKKIVLTWIKDSTLSWAKDKLDDQGFIDSLQYLVDSKILGLPEPEKVIELKLVIVDEPEPEPIYIVDSWVRTTALWWGQGKISDQDYINALEYLIENKIVSITKPEPKLPEPEIESKPIPELELKQNIGIGLEETKNISTSWSPISRIGDFFVQGHPDVSSTRLDPSEYFFQFTLISSGGGERDCTTISDQTKRILCQIEKSPNRAGKFVSADGTVSILIMDSENRPLYLDSFSVHKTHFQRAFDTSSSDEFLAYSWDIPTSKVKKGFGTFGTAKLVFTDRSGNSFSSDFEGVAIPHFT